jgi:hypothetical protein
MELLQYGFSGLVIFGLISIAVFLLFRSIILWYWNIDKIVRNQNNQTTLMKQQKELLEQIYLLQGGHKLTGSTESKGEIERKAKLFDQSNKSK